MAIRFDKKPKRDTPVTVRLTAETVKKLKEIAAKHAVTQTDVLEKLIEIAHEDLRKRK